MSMGREKLVRSRWISLIIGAFCVLMIAIFLQGCARRETVCTFGSEGKGTKVIDVKTGEEINLQKFIESGRAVFLNFWGIMCVSCLEELKKLNDVYENYRDSRVVFIAVNTDGLSPERLKKVMEEKGIDVKFKVVADPSLSLTERFANGFIPHNVVITPACEVAFEATGFNEKIFKQLTGTLLEYR